MTDYLNAIWSNDRAAPTDTNPNNLELAPPQSVAATRLDHLVYSPNYYIQIFQTQPFARSEDWALNRSLEDKVQHTYQLRYGSYNQATSVQTVELNHKMWEISSLAPHTRLTWHQRIYGGIRWDQFVRLAISTTETLTDLTTDLVVANNNINQYCILETIGHIGIYDMGSISDLFLYKLNCINEGPIFQNKMGPCTYLMFY